MYLIHDSFIELAPYYNGQFCLFSLSALTLSKQSNYPSNFLIMFYDCMYN